MDSPAEGLGGRSRLDMGLEPLGIDLGGRRDEEKVGTRLPTDPLVPAKIARIGAEILVRPELRRVDEDAHPVTSQAAALSLIRAAWPSCRKPIVGTKPTRGPGCRNVSIFWRISDRARGVHRLSPFREY